MYRVGRKNIRPYPSTSSTATEIILPTEAQPTSSAFFVILWRIDNWAEQIKVNDLLEQALSEVWWWLL
jgi:hypothetical protein